MNLSIKSASMVHIRFLKLKCYNIPEFSRFYYSTHFTTDVVCIKLEHQVTRKAGYITYRIYTLGTRDKHET
jgi:hypothetical protein